MRSIQGQNRWFGEAKKGSTRGKVASSFDAPLTLLSSLVKAPTLSPSKLLVCGPKKRLQSFWASVAGADGKFGFATHRGATRGGAVDVVSGSGCGGFMDEKNDWIVV